NVKDLYGAIITIGYDTKVVEFKTASEGPLLKKDGQQTSFLFSNNTKAGSVDIYMTRIGDVGGVEGTDSLFTISFQGKSSGASDLVIRSQKLTNFSREQVKADAKGARVVVK
ncbi:MAG: cohesin domain-containing protein, partial [Candidatus Brocadiaceae bacterium]|nr:cohesin domain-containing protein [Candidatus Brocadiaceae bacterium]